MRLNKKRIKWLGFNLNKDGYYTLQINAHAQLKLRLYGEFGQRNTNLLIEEHSYFRGIGVNKNPVALHLMSKGRVGFLKLILLILLLKE